MRSAPCDRCVRPHLASRSLPSAATCLIAALLLVRPSSYTLLAAAEWFSNASEYSCSAALRVPISHAAFYTGARPFRTCAQAADPGSDVCVGHLDGNKITGTYHSCVALGMNTAAAAYPRPAAGARPC
jgi:hypothetical protein